MRTALYLFYPIVLLIGCPKSQDSPPNQAPDFMKISAPGDSDPFEKLVAIKTDSYHVFLREASLLVPPQLKERSWSDVQELMKAHQFPIIKSWDNGDAVHSYHVIKKKFVVFPKGHVLDLCLLLSASNLDRGHLPARPGTINRADVALVAEFDEPHAGVVKQGRFPQGTVLAAVLASATVKQAGEVWPILKRIYVYYGYISNHHLEHNPSGFFADLEFVASLTEEIAGKTMYFSVASGLDPLQSPEGQNQQLEGFKPQDTLWGVSPLGSNEWWQGEPKVVEGNRRKYLKKQD
jgi:hypothetical protein